MLKITVQNLSEEPIKLFAALSNFLGNIQFELKPPGTEKFVSLVTPNFALRADTVSPGISLPAKKEYVSYEVIFVKRDGSFVFSKSGTYELRTKVELLQEVLVSEPIVIEVKEVTQDERECLRLWGCLLNLPALI